MTQASVTQEAPPPISDIQGTQNVGTSETLASKPNLFYRVLFKYHGFLGAVTFIGFLPLGVFAIRFGGSKAFVGHWIIESLSLITGLVSIFLGIIASQESKTVRFTMPNPLNLHGYPVADFCLGLTVSQFQSSSSGSRHIYVVCVIDSSGCGDPTSQEIRPAVWTNLVYSCASMARAITCDIGSA
jgi:hypothetical protein